MRALALAGNLLTIVPWPGAPEEAGPEDLAKAVARFPFVGLAIGLVLVVLDFLLLAAFPAPVRNGILVVALAAVTGGLHLDGLSDFADALAGGKDREDRLRIMKESSCGPMGAAAIACVLILKYAALSGLAGGERWSALLLAPVVGRAAMAYLLTSLPYARPEGGTGRAFAEAASPGEGHAAVGWALALSLVLGFVWGVAVALLAGLLTLGIRRLLDFSLGGGTGDGYGAAGETVEAFALVLFAAW